MLTKSLLGTVLTLVIAGCSQGPTGMGAQETGDTAESAVVAAADEADDTFEFAQAHPQRVPMRIQRFDANKDGMLQANEIPERLRTWFSNVDANKDNVVTADEIRTWNRAHPHQHRHHGQHGQGQHGQQQGQPGQQQMQPQQAPQRTLDVHPSDVSL